MTLFVEELNHFFILAISELILDYSHFPKKIKLISSLSFERYHVHGKKKMIKHIDFINEYLMDIYYDEDQTAYLVMNFFTAYASSGF